VRSTRTAPSAPRGSAVPARPLSEAQRVCFHGPKVGSLQGKCRIDWPRQAAVSITAGLLQSPCVDGNSTEDTGRPPRRRTGWGVLSPSPRVDGAPTPPAARPPAGPGKTGRTSMVGRGPPRLASCLRSGRLGASDLSRGEDARPRGLQPRR
jgi:hypothetical protein